MPTEQGNSTEAVNGNVRRANRRIMEGFEYLGAFHDTAAQIAYLEAVQAEVCNQLDALYERGNGE